MKTSVNGLDFLAKQEGLKLKAYQDQAGIWTIGIGSTRYENGEPIKPGDEITRERAIELFKNTLARFEVTVSMATKGLNQNQFDATVSLTYNIGEAAFRISTVRGKILSNPNDKDGITAAWMRWNKIRDPKTKQLVFNKGLNERRKRELALYFS